MDNQQVILVDEQDRVLGAMEKMEAHRQGILHRAFSVFIFNSANEMLLQQRAHDKYHSGGLWSNACCSHPNPGEETLAAANRRLAEELGFQTSLSQLFSFTYRAPFQNGLIENEFDHVFVGQYDGDLNVDPVEVSDWRFLSMTDIKTHLENDPNQFTAWFRIAFPLLEERLEKKPV